nr:hypothetical protein [Clostridioides difficile]
MVNYSLEHKNLYIEFMCSELDHHVANEIREEIDNLLSVNQVKMLYLILKILILWILQV